MAKEFEHDAELRDWRYGSRESGPCIFGAIYNDKKRRFADGDRVRTSRIVSLENGRLVSESGTRYLLVNT